jgi:NADH dehydrogenase
VEETRQIREVDKRPVIVIVGAGFGGLNAAKTLHHAPVDVILVDRNNYHLFQPLLYQVATAGLSPSDIAYPVRAIFRRQANFDFRLAEVQSTDLAGRCLNTSTGPITYDYLVLAFGGETNYFGLESVAKNGFSLKDLRDADAIRNHILKMLELSTQVKDKNQRRALRTFVIVGGGPTGVESAGALSELLRLALSKDFQRMKLSDVRVLILEASERLLPGFPEDLAKSALETLRKKHVEVRFGAAVIDYDRAQVALRDGDTIQACTLVWAAGVKAVSLTEDMGVPLGKQSRIRVDATLQLADHPEAYVIGDAAYLEEAGHPLPMMAPVAIQQAKVVAINTIHSLERLPPIGFEYKDPGSLATIGRNAAVARVGRFKFYGLLAWLVWLAVHLVWLIGFRNRLLVLINWAWDYFLFERAVRLILPSSENHK